MLLKRQHYIYIYFEIAISFNVPKLYPSNMDFLGFTLFYMAFVNAKSSQAIDCITYLIIISGYEPGGREFESLRAR